MKHKVDWFRVAGILLFGGLAILAVIYLGESDIAWLIP